MKYLNLSLHEPYKHNFFQTLNPNRENPNAFWGLSHLNGLGAIISVLVPYPLAKVTNTTTNTYPQFQLLYKT